MFSAILHERDHRKALFIGEALNCVASAYDPHKNIKMCIDTGVNLPELINRVERNFADYLSLTEVVKIINDLGEIVYTVRSSRYPRLTYVPTT